MNKFAIRLAAWLDDPMTQAVVASVFLYATWEGVAAAHRRIDRLERVTSLRAVTRG